jgi:hypothetical protein
MPIEEICKGYNILIVVFQCELLVSSVGVSSRIPTLSPTIYQTMVCSILLLAANVFALDATLSVIHSSAAGSVINDYRYLVLIQV